jgi:ribonuclease Z
MIRVLKWIVIFAALIFAVLLLVRALFAEQIGEAVFKRAFAKQLSADPLAGLEDGLHVVLIGTGSPMPDPSRAGPSTAVIAGDEVYVIDSGGGTPRNMGEMRLAPARVKAVFLTHLHSDHIDGLGELAMQRWAGGGHSTPLRVYGPEGTQQVTDGFEQAYQIDSVFRVTHHGQDVLPQSGFGMVASTVKMAIDEDTYPVLETDSGLKVTAFKVDHDPVNPAMGYRFDYKGRSVTLTGDTAFDPRISAVAKGTDILVHEALNAEMVTEIETAMKEAGNQRLGQIMFDIKNYHATPVEAAETAQTADAGALVFSHIVPALPSPALYPYFLKGTGEVYDGPIVMGEDGMMLSLPADGSKMTRRRLQ